MVVILEFSVLTENKVQQVFDTNNLSCCCNNFVLKLEMGALTHNLESLYLPGAADEISKSQQAFIQS